VVVIETVLVKLASRCNLDCDYCYIYHMGDDGWRRQPKRMSLETAGALGQRLAALLKVQRRPFSVVFHGGEPLLIGAERLDEVCRELRAALPDSCPLALQTNGVLLSDAVVACCQRHNVGVSVSLDGPASVHDRHRLDRRGRASHAAVTAGIGRLTASPEGRALFSGVLAVVDLESDPVEVYESLKATGTPSIDFLYRDGNHDTLPIGKASAVSDEYGRWMGRLLDHYLADRSPTPVRVLDDMLRILLGGVATKEGLGTTSFGILVVETDGTISKNDTLKSAHRSADRFATVPSVHTHDLSEVVATDEYVGYQNGQQPSSAICRACPDLKVCGGGMPAHRWSSANGFDNPSVFCADQKTLAEHMRRHLRRHRIAA
jgi:uncharacterized protein